MFLLMQFLHPCQNRHIDSCLERENAFPLLLYVSVQNCAKAGGSFLAVSFLAEMSSVSQNPAIEC